MSKCRFTASVLTVFLFTAHASNPAPQDRDAILNNVIEISEQNALNASKVNWPSARLTAIEILQHDNSEGGLADAIRYVLSKLEDRHSSYRPPSGSSRQSVLGARLPKPIALTSESPAGTPVLAVNSWAGADARLAATETRQALTSALRHKPCGIIIDLSANSGGNMWPMVMGLLPLYSEGILGGFKGRDGAKTSIISTGNGLLVPGSPHFLNALELPEPEQSPRFIAVIVGPTTASSGEVTALLFKGQTNVRFFGQPTAGVSTANRVFTLENGGSVALTTASVEDRAGNTYGTPLIPDSTSLAPVGEADAWIKQACNAKAAL